MVVELTVEQSNELAKMKKQWSESASLVALQLKAFNTDEAENQVWLALIDHFEERATSGNGSPISRICIYDSQRSTELPIKLYEIFSLQLVEICKCFSPQVFLPPEQQELANLKELYVDAFLDRLDISQIARVNKLKTLTLSIDGCENVDKKGECINPGKLPSKLWSQIYEWMSSPNCSLKSLNFMIDVVEIAMPKPCHLPYMSFDVDGELTFADEESEKNYAESTFKSNDYDDEIEHNSNDSNCGCNDCQWQDDADKLEDGELCEDDEADEEDQPPVNKKTKTT